MALREPSGEPGYAGPEAAGADGPISSGTQEVACDIAILGGGPGGYAAALYASRLGLRAVVVERDKVGGTCLHRGCIPTKHYLETAAVLRTVAKAPSFGVFSEGGDGGGPRIDWARVLDKKSAVVERIFKGLQGLLRSADVQVLQGSGSLDDSGRIRVESLDGSRWWVRAGKGVVLATGSAPRSLDVLPFDGRVVVSSDEVLELGALPRSVVIVGAGSVGVELASYLSDFGVQVTLVEALSNVIPGADAEVATALRRSLEGSGIRTLCDAQVLGAQVHEDGSGVPNATVSVRTRDGDEQVLGADLVVVAVGRRPVTEGIGLEDVGIRTEASGHIFVDPESLATSQAGYWAVGDVVATPGLAHVAFAEGMVAVRAIAGEDPRPVDYSRVPYCVYSHPEVAFCGLTEEAARSVHGDDKVKVSRSNFASNARASIMEERRGLLKVVVLEEGPVLGVHIVGPWASELLSPGYLAANWEAFPEEIASFVQPHPTLSETFGEAAMALIGRPLHG